jgi:hypothetical protein
MSSSGALCVQRSILWVWRHVSNHSEEDGLGGDSEGNGGNWVLFWHRKLRPSSFVGGNRGVWFLPCSGEVGRLKGRGLLVFLDPGGFEREDRSRIARVVGHS